MKLVKKGKINKAVMEIPGTQAGNRYWGKG